MDKKIFNYKLRDSQGTYVEPMSPRDFDYAKYADYEAGKLEDCRKFMEGDEGILIYRRFRVPEVFAEASRDMKKSLELQLGALNASMDYKADIPNFLEPWYGIGLVDAGFGAKYQWNENQAPATEAQFKTVTQALNYPCLPIEETEIGRYNLEMIDYFLNATSGKLPISFSDIQSPLNAASSIVDISGFFMDLYDRPEQVKDLMNKIAGLTSEYLQRQKTLIGSCLALPGHGFASSRSFKGLGMSDDNILMISNEQYVEFAAPVNHEISQAFGGLAFHSCGDWTGKIQAIKANSKLLFADGAFTRETDPNAMDGEGMGSAFQGTGTVLHVRVVGDVETLVEKVKRIYRPGLKLIVATYLEDPEDQTRAYDLIHALGK